MAPKKDKACMKRLVFILVQKKDRENMEDIQKICDLITLALKETDAYRDIVKITYVKSQRTIESHIVIHYISGTRIICTTMKDGMDVIRIILENIGE